MTLEKINEKKRPIYHIKSFVCRQRHLTKKQQSILDSYFPVIGIKFNNDVINFIKLFDYTAPVHLEIGFGMGTSLVNTAKRYPEYNFLGIEVYLPGIISCLSLAKKKDIKNLRLIYHDAVEVLYRMIPENSLNVIQLFFPDPWPKIRHNKRRIIQDSFIKLINKKLKLGGILHIVTDWKPYALHILEVISLFNKYEKCFERISYAPQLLERPITKFEQRGYYLGHSIWNLIFNKVK